MARQDWKQRFKNIQEKLGSSRPKDQDDASGSSSVAPQKHQTEASSNTSIRNHNGSHAVLAHTDQASKQASKKDDDITPAGSLLRSSQGLANLRSTDAPIQELWNIAYEKLREEDSELIKTYEKKLRGNMLAGLGSMLGSNASMRDRMQTILEHKMNEVNANVWKLKFRSSEVDVRDLVQPILGTVNLVNEYVTDAVSLNSVTSLAWVGISLLLPLFMNPLKQMASLAKGLAFSSTLIAQSRIREELYVRRYEVETNNGQSFQQSHREYKNGLEQLYRQILKFQVTSYCYFTDDSASRICLDVIKRNNWDQLVDGIREQETLFAKLATTWRDIQYDNECSAAENRHQKAMNLWFTIGRNVSILERAVKDAQEQNDRIELLRWLCDIDHTELYNNARSKHKDGTGEWLIDRSEAFNAWEESIALKSFLWLHGKAGSGKSILSSSVIKHLEDQYKGNAMTVVAHFYFSFSDIEKQKVDGMLASLIKQISAHRPYIPQSVQRLAEYKNKGGRPDTETLIEALIASMQGFSAVYIIIDALDECPMLNDERKKLLNSVRHILKAAPDSLHVLCTSRKENDIDKAIKPLFVERWGAELDLNIQREALNDDISKYIDSILADAEYDTWPEDIKEESRNALTEKADGMFQYVRCQFENLQNLSSVDAVRKALQDLPNGLDSTYERMLQCIDANFQPQVIASLKWLTFSIWPLAIDELAEIFVLPSTSNDGFDKMSRLFSSMDVLKYFPGLIVTEERYTGPEFMEKRRGILHVRLAHFSIKEYLTSDRILQSRASVFAFTEADAHMHIGRLCLAYHLHISSTAKISNYDEYNEVYHEYKLAKYASKNWTEHIEMIPRTSWPPEVLRDALLSLSAHSQSLFNMVFKDLESTDFIRKPYLYTVLRGFPQLTEILISNTAGVNKYLTQMDLDEGLRYAAIYRRKTIVQLFLSKGAQLHNYLEIAAGQGDVMTVKLLLDHRAEVTASTGELGSALIIALWSGHLDMLKLLLSCGADVNSPFNKVDYMPHSAYLLRASRQLHIVDCLCFLFDNGAGVNMKENYSLAAALYVAAHFGYNAASRQLLDRGADVNELAGQYGYPLQAAILSFTFDFEFIVCLLDHGANPNAQVGTGSTALQTACTEMFGHNSKMMPQVIELLIDRGADISVKGGEHETALQAACRNRFMPIAVIKLLLKKGADVNAQGGRYGNALQAACGRTHDWSNGYRLEPMAELKEGVLEIVRLLLNNGADVHAQGGHYGTTLQAACAGENEEVVRLLIDRDANVIAQGGQYGTALQAACATGNLDVVRLLLKKGANVNVEAGYYGTALQAACARSHTQVARVLLENGAKIHTGSNGAWYAVAIARNNDLVSLLLDHGADVNYSCSSHGSPLHGLLQLRGQTCVRPRREDSERDPLDSWMEIERYSFDWTSRVQLLLKRGADPNLTAGDYGTALHTACTVSSYLPSRKKARYYGAAGSKLLLELCPNINVNALGGLYGSALQAAAFSGQTPTISLLLKRGAHVNARGGKFGSALNAAVIAGNWDIVQMLLDAGATPDCYVLSEPDEEWLQRVLKYGVRGGVERYRKFWEVEKAEREVSAN
ncbi:ankyrin repeat-containing domain protein [Trichoderma velutinum]